MCVCVCVCVCARVRACACVSGCRSVCDVSGSRGMNTNKLYRLSLGPTFHQYVFEF